MNREVRIAGTQEKATFTPRGKGDNIHQRGFIRAFGLTVSGYVYDGQTERVFYPGGINADVLYKALEVQAA